MDQRAGKQPGKLSWGFGYDAGKLRKEIAAVVRPIFDLGQDWMGNGKSRRQELEDVQEQTGKPQEGLSVPSIPNMLERPMQIWQRLHARRQTGMSLGNFTYPDLGWYMTIHRDVLSEGDMEIVDIIDSEFRKSVAAAEEARNKKIK